MSSPSVLHVNDAAFTAERMIREARRRGLVWDLLPKAASDQPWPGVTGRIRRAAIGGRWVARLAVQARRHDVVHVHSASTVAHSRLGAPRFVVHCHGTDVRTAQYDPRRSSSIVEALHRAEAVLYSTPDLAEHVLPHRADAVYLPVPVDVDAVPEWSPASDRRPQVVFASRWSPDKGVDTQVAVARALTARFGERIDLVGLDWGPCTAEAAAVGVRLVPRSGHGDYLALLAGASVVVGQAAGILAASELEALAAGAPLVVPAPLPLYENPPALAVPASDAADAVWSVLDGTHRHDRLAVREWTRGNHGVVRAVDTVTELHSGVLAARG